MARKTSAACTTMSRNSPSTMSFCVVEACKIAIGMVSVTTAASACARRSPPSWRAMRLAITAQPASAAHCTELNSQSDPVSR